MNDQMKKRVAVVIPIKNERHGLMSLLESLEQQMGTQDEVICIDAGSTDGSWELLTRFAKTHPQFRIAREAGAYPGAARNAAIRRTDARFIAQIDGGNIPCENWLSEIIDPLLNGQADYVMGDVAIKPVMKTIKGRHVDMGCFYGASIFRDPHLRAKQLRPPAGGASVAYKRHIWQTAGGFPEWLRTGEDRLFAQKLNRQDLRIVFAPQAIVYWEIGPTLIDFLKRHLYHQRVKVRQIRKKKKGLKGIALQFSFLITLAAAIFHPTWWPLPVACFGVAVLYQTRKSVRAYYRRSHKQDIPSPMVVIIFLVLESMVFPAKLLGTFQALFRSRRDGQCNQHRVEEYLAS